MRHRRLQQHVAHAGLQRRRARDRIVGRVGVFELETDDEQADARAQAPVTCRLAGVVFAPINAVMSARAGAEVERQQCESQSNGSDAVSYASIVVQSRVSPVKSHHYSQHAAALRTELGHTLTREQMRTFHTKDACASFPGRRPAVRDPRADHLGADRRHQPAHLDSARLRAGFHRLQLHGAAARGRPPHDLHAPPSGRGARARLAVRRAERDLREPVHALAPGSSRRARLRRGRSQAASPVAEDQRAVVQAAVLFAGAVSRSTSAPRGGRARRIPRRCSGGSPSNARSRSRRTCRCWR